MSKLLTAITFKLAESLWEKIKTQAAAEERSESGFLRFHLEKLFAMSEAETDANEDETTRHTVL